MRRSVSSRLQRAGVASITDFRNSRRSHTCEATATTASAHNEYSCCPPSTSAPSPAPLYTAHKPSLSSYSSSPRLPPFTASAAVVSCWSGRDGRREECVLLTPLRSMATSAYVATTAHESAGGENTEMEEEEVDGVVLPRSAKLRHRRGAHRRRGAATPPLSPVAAATMNNTINDSNANHNGHALKNGEAAQAASSIAPPAKSSATPAVAEAEATWLNGVGQRATTQQQSTPAQSEASQPTSTKIEKVKKAPQTKPKGNARRRTQSARGSLAEAEEGIGETMDAATAATMALQEMLSPQQTPLNGANGHGLHTEAIVSITNTATATAAGASTREAVAGVPATPPHSEPEKEPKKTSTKTPAVASEEVAAEDVDFDEAEDDVEDEMKTSAAATRRSAKRPRRRNSQRNSARRGATASISHDVPEEELIDGDDPPAIAPAAENNISAAAPATTEELMEDEYDEDAEVMAALQKALAMANTADAEEAAAAADAVSSTLQKEAKVEEEEEDEDDMGNDDHLVEPTVVKPKATVMTRGPQCRRAKAAMGRTATTATEVESTTEEVVTAAATAALPESKEAALEFEAEEEAEDIETTAVTKPTAAAPAEEEAPVRGGKGRQRRGKRARAAVPSSTMHQVDNTADAHLCSVTDDVPEGMSDEVLTAVDDEAAAEDTPAAVADAEPQRRALSTSATTAAKKADGTAMRRRITQAIGGKTANTTEAAVEQSAENEGDDNDELDDMEVMSSISGAAAALTTAVPAVVVDDHAASQKPRSRKKKKLPLRRAPRGARAASVAHNFTASTAKAAAAQAEGEDVDDSSAEKSAIATPASPLPNPTTTKSAEEQSAPPVPTTAVRSLATRRRLAAEMLRQRWKLKQQQTAKTAAAKADVQTSAATSTAAAPAEEDFHAEEEEDEHVVTRAASTTAAASTTTASAADEHETEKAAAPSAQRRRISKKLIVRSRAAAETAVEEDTEPALPTSTAAAPTAKISPSPISAAEVKSHQSATTATAETKEEDDTEDTDASCAAATEKEKTNVSTVEAATHTVVDDLGALPDELADAEEAVRDAEVAAAVTAAIALAAATAHHAAQAPSSSLTDPMDVLTSPVTAVVQAAATRHNRSGVGSSHNSGGGKKGGGGAASGGSSGTGNGTGSGSGSSGGQKGSNSSSGNSSSGTDALFYPDYREQVVKIFEQMAEINNALGERYKALSYSNTVERFMRGDKVFQLLPPNLLPLPEDAPQWAKSAAATATTDPAKRRAHEVEQNRAKRRLVLSPDNLLPGIGSKLRLKVQEILETGDLAELHTLEAKPIIRALRELTQVHGFGPRTALEFFRKYNITTVKELQEYAVKHGELDMRNKETGRPAALKASTSTGASSNKNVFHLNDAQRLGLVYYRDMSHRIPHDEGRLHEAFLKLRLRKYLGKDYELVVCGSYRRQVPMAGDIDVLITHRREAEEGSSNSGGGKNSADTSSSSVPPSHVLSALLAGLKADKYIEATLAQGPTKFMGLCRLRPLPSQPSSDPSSSSAGASPKFRARRLDIRYVDIDCFPAAMLYFTGSKNFNVIMRSEAIKRRCVLNEYGLFRKLSRKEQMQRQAEGKPLLNLHEAISKIAKFGFASVKEIKSGDVSASMANMEATEETDGEETEGLSSGAVTSAAKKLKKKSKAKAKAKVDLEELCALSRLVEKQRVTAYSEKEIFDALDMDYVAPKERNV